MKWLYELLTRKSSYIILFLGSISLVFTLVGFKTTPFPDFRDPSLGFEARGTLLGERLTAWQNLLDELRPSGSLVDNPKDILPELISLNFKKRKRTRVIQKYVKNRMKHRLNSRPNLGIHLNSSRSSASSFKIKNFDARSTSLSNNGSIEEKCIIKETSGKNGEDKPSFISADVKNNGNGYFCESLSHDFSSFVVVRKENNSDGSLFEISTLLAMCDLENKITSVAGYTDYCQKEISLNACCRPWSLPNYIALLANKLSCYEINKTDVTAVEQILVRCHKYFHRLDLTHDCQRYKCAAPTDCTKFNAVYNIFHFLTDVNFMKPNESSLDLTSAMIFVPIAKSMKILPFFHNMGSTNLENNLVKIVAMDLGLKNALFDEWLLSDFWLVGLGGVLIIISMWLYTNSIFLTVMTVIAIFLSLGIAYFVYSLVLKMSFFPFMNLLAVVVLIGIGADDAFIFVKIWRCVHSERERDLYGPPVGVQASVHSDSMDSEANIMVSTIKHAALSMFVTSFTTAAAFYASYISSITSVKCFGIFAGTAVISNNIVMITWLPASVSIMRSIKCPFAVPLGLKTIIERIGITAETCIITAVTKAPTLWMSVLGIIGISSSFFVLYWPRLQLPESSNFPLLLSNHPFEIYEAKYRQNFRFEQLTDVRDNMMPLRFVWGIEAIDKGDFSNPFSKGSLYFDKNFNLSSIQAQSWLMNFCATLKKQPFYRKSFGLLSSNCFIENFVTWMNRRCFDKMDGMDKKPCCEISKFPYLPHIFEYCLPQSISAYFDTPREFFVPSLAGPKFRRNGNDFNSSFSPIAKALVIEYESSISYTMSYSKVKNFVEAVEKWFDEELLSAPPEMKCGWFVSDLMFFNLQSALSTGTVISIGIAMSVSLLILLLMTLNILISFYAVLTISLTIFTTVAILIYFGWKMNILESISITTAIGLAVDFSLHYSIQYRLSPHSDRRRATRFALFRMIGPTAMAAGTTIVAGALMLTSNVLPYIQIGLFLVVLNTISWLYSTFFLMSLLQLFGPQYGFMQLNYPWSIVRKKRGSATVIER